MNYPYSSFRLETRKAQLKLAFVFQAPPGQRPEDPRLSNDEDIPTSKDQQPAANRPSASLSRAQARRLLRVERNGKSPGRPYWMREDSGPTAFAWTLLPLEPLQQQ